MPDDGKHLYEFTEAGFFAGTHYQAGERIRLYPRQAQYETHRMRPVAAPAAAAPQADEPRQRAHGRRAARKE